jgi:neutral trehalase
MLKNGQLCWGSDPYVDDTGQHWAKHGVNEFTGAILESGLDNSPMYDNVPFNKDTCRMELADVGLTGLYIMDCECLAELAGCIGRPEALELWERAERSKAGLEELWDEETGCYVNRRTDTGEFYRRLSPTHFYALLSDTVSPARAGRMVREHFFNPAEFYGEYMLPSIARGDPGYKDQNYWRGRIWAPMNYLAYISLRRAGQGEACRVLAEKSKNLILKEWTEEGHVHENYNGDTGDGDDVKNSDRFYHWGGLLSFIALMEAGFVEGPEKPL